MPRQARLVAAGLPHHVIQRGVRSMAIFSSDADRRAYLELLAAAGERHGLRFLAWCLMTNHVHLLVVPREAGSLRGIGDAHWRYTRLVNFREKVRGHLFQERFRSYVVQRDEHLAAVGRYVELNPVGAGLTGKAEEWPWSSAAFNVGDRPDDPLVGKRELEALFGPWKRVLRGGEEEIGRERIESHAATGFPLGSDPWVRRLEGESERRLRPGKPGRPKGRTSKPGRSVRGAK
jgi:putative transposase